MSVRLVIFGGAVIGAGLALWATPKSVASPEVVRPAANDVKSSQSRLHTVIGRSAARPETPRPEVDEANLTPSSAAARPAPTRARAALARPAPAPVNEPPPEFPPNRAEVRRQAFAEAIAKNTQRPGEFAYRAAVSEYVRHNQAFAEAQAEKVGLTLEEIEELTFFGLLTQETQRWPDVEELLGHAVDDAVRQQIARVRDELNREFKSHMGQLVDEGVSPEERWAYIQEVEKRYKAAYYEATGMSEDLLDALMAGDAGRAYAAGAQVPAPAEGRSDDAP